MKTTVSLQAPALSPNMAEPAGRSTPRRLLSEGTRRARRGVAPYLAGGSIGLTSPQSLEMNLPDMSFWMCMVIFGLTMSAAVLTV